MSPATLEELVAAVRAHPRVLPVGAGTKARLATAAPGFTPLSTRALRGIVEYEPDEFTFTARAGTPLTELAAVLGERGQYLPFDPPLAAAGATLGGTVAAGLSGPGRWRFGGVRDFILGARFVDGEGRLLRVGGKVVKTRRASTCPSFWSVALAAVASSPSSRSRSSRGPPRPARCGSRLATRWTRSGSSGPAPAGAGNSMP